MDLFSLGVLLPKIWKTKLSQIHTRESGFDNLFPLHIWNSWSYPWKL